LSAATLNLGAASRVAAPVVVRKKSRRRIGLFVLAALLWPPCRDAASGMSRLRSLPDVAVQFQCHRRDGPRMGLVVR
jgi:hypothetical protein